MSRIDFRNIHRKNKVLNLKLVKQSTQIHCVEHRVNLTELNRPRYYLLTLTGVFKSFHLRHIIPHNSTTFFISSNFILQILLLKLLFLRSDCYITLI